MKIQKKLKFTLVFLTVNFFLSLVISSLYIFFSKRFFFESIFLILALISNTFMLYIPLILLSCLFVFLPLWRLLLISISGFFQLLLVIDVIVYKFWSFHINPMVINILTTPGGIQSLEQSWNVKAYFAALVIVILLIEVSFYYISKSIFNKISSFKKYKFYFLLLLAIVFIEKIIFALSYLYNDVKIIRNRETFPLYQPLTIRKFASRYLGFNLNNKVNTDINISKTVLNYPRNPIVIENPRKYNIVILVADALRYDMLDKEIMPFSYEFSKKANLFLNHYSGGNCTRFGIFSIFYGLYGNYWFKMIETKRGPVLIELLKKLGYDFKIISSSKLTFPEFNKTCFVDIESSIDDEHNSDVIYLRDIESANRAIKFLKGRKGNKNPYLLFVFFDSSHGVFDYPREFEKFKPSHGVNLLTLNKNNVLPLFNKYKNSIYFEDSLIGKIIKEIDLKNTIVIITGDHGEAFFEKGYTGHNHSYSKEETSVAFVYYQPSLKPSKITYRTSHFDIVPTIGKAIGVKNPPDDYSSGYGLFEKNKWDKIYVFSWDNMGIIFDSYTVVIPFSIYSGNIKVYSNDKWELLNINDRHYLQFVAQFKKDLLRFIKK